MGQIKLLLLNARKAISLVTDTDSKSPAYRRLQINIHFTYTVTRHDSKYREQICRLEKKPCKLERGAEDRKVNFL